MNKNDKSIDITFLFGAGSEVQFGISGGLDFAKTVIGENTITMNAAIKTYYKRNFHDWYPKYQYYKFDSIQIFEAALKKKLLEEKCELNNKKEFDALIEEKSQISLAKKEKILDKYTSYMGVLDEKFHTLISPKYLGPKKFWGVVSCYTRAYLLITGEMVKMVDGIEPTQKDYIKMLQNPLEYYKKWGFITTKKSNYYDIILKHKENNKFAVVTTNYTPICENITRIDDIAHVNGRLNWFESPYELKVYDVTEQQETNIDDVRFPYIFVQSGIKPIIEEKQIYEYGKMSRYFNDAKTIVVVGYRINGDDNHINSFLRSAVNNDKKIIYFNYKRDLTRHQIYSRLRLVPFEKNNIEIVDVNEQDCITKFEQIVLENVL